VDGEPDAPRRLGRGDRPVERGDRTAAGRRGTGMGRRVAPSPGRVMLALTPATRIFVAVAPVDLRRGFDGLCAHVQTVLAQQVAEGGLFVFTNRRRERVS